MLVGEPKFHSWGRCTMTLTNMHSDLRFNPSSGLCISYIILYYVDPLFRILECNDFNWSLLKPSCDWISFLNLSCRLVQSEVTYLQLSEHVGYSNMFSKATPTISSYFRRREAGFSCSNDRYRVFQGSIYPLYSSWRHRITWYGQDRLHNKGENNCWTQPLGISSLPHEMETEQWLTVVCILALATYAVSSSSPADP